MTSTPTRIAVLAHAGVLGSSGYARRVLDCAHSLRRAMPCAVVTVASLETPRNLRRRVERQAVTLALTKAGIAFHVVHAWPRRWGLAGLSNRLAAATFARFLDRERIDVVHAHGPDALALAFAARGGRGVRVVADVHGDRATEAMLDRGEGGGFDVPPDSTEAAAVAKADGVVYASEGLRERLPAGAGRSSIVVTCLVSDESIPSETDAEGMRLAARKARGLAGDEWVAAYVGSLASWQEFPRFARIVRHLTDRVPQFRVLVLTPDRAAAEACLREAGVPTGRVIVRTAAQGVVVSDLLAADAGVLLRRPALANALAFPTKFAEYAAAGLEIVVSDAVPSVAGIVSRHPGLGHVLPWEKDDSTWAARLAGASRPSEPAARAARRAFARSHLATSSSDGAYARLYDGLGLGTILTRS